LEIQNEIIKFKTSFRAHVSDEDRQQRNPVKQPHIILCYQWNDQKLIEDVYKYLKKAQKMSVWMDKHGGIQDNVFHR
jgi:hypothetical protein